MKPDCYLGIDTSNYTTSAALLDEKMQDIRNKMTPYLSEEERAVQAAKDEKEKIQQEKDA